jgi:hypothetical protein
MSNPRELLTAADIVAMEPARSVHPLNENAVRLKRSLGDATGLTQLGFHLMTLMPGHESTEYHRHLYAESASTFFPALVRRLLTTALIRLAPEISWDSHAVVSHTRC